MKIELWRAGVLEFESLCEYENPFLDVSIWAKFVSPSGKEILREAYWDGGKTYKVSFAPTQLGVWKYELSAPLETGLNAVCGEIEAVEYEGDLDIYKHGFLKVSENKKYLTYNDGTPFFWLGDTHWGFIAGEKWDESNYDKTDSMFKYMVDKRVSQRFTVYQTNLRSESWFRMPGLSYNTHFWADDHLGTLPDVEFYKNEVDKRMQYIADSGLVNALGFAWGSSIVGKLELHKNLARYMVARYGALPMVWTLAGESIGYFPSMKEECLASWNEVALLVEKLDSYGQLQTTHYTNERPYCDYYFDEDWYDFTLNQAGHGDLDISEKWVIEHRNKHPEKPFIEGETMYEYCSTLEANGSRLCTADMMRRTAYLNMQLGAAGYTYGAQGIWDTVYEKPETPNPFNRFNKFGIAWYEAIEAPGAQQLEYMRDFYEKYNWYELSPSPEMLRKGEKFADVLLPGGEPLVLSSCDKSLVLIYLPEYIFKPISIFGLTKEKYNAKWFDPRTAQYTDLGEVSVEDGSLAGYTRPGGSDWVLVLETK